MPMIASTVAVGGGYVPAIVYDGEWFANYGAVFTDIQDALQAAIDWAAYIREQMR